jgi:hypothetical protein
MLRNMADNHIQRAGEKMLPVSILFQLMRISRAAEIFQRTI